MEMRKFHFPPASVQKEIAQWPNRKDTQHAHRAHILQEICSLMDSVGGYVPVPPLGIDSEPDPRLTSWFTERLSPSEDHPDDIESANVCMQILAASVALSDTPNWYTVTLDFVLAMLGSDMHDVSLEDILLPHPAVFLEFPPGHLFISGENADDYMELRAIGVEIRENPGVGSTLLVMDIIHDPSRQSTYQFGNRITLNIGNDIYKTFSPEQAHAFIPLMLGEGGRKLSASDIGKILIGTLVHISQASDIERKVSHTKKQPKGKKIWAARPPSPEQSARNLLDANTWLVGTKVKLHPEVREAIGRGDITGRKQHRTVVAGHYHRYRHGPRDNWHYETHWIWPFVRGEGEGPVLGHTYDA